MDMPDQFETVRGFLKTQSTLVLSTSNESGEPYSAPLFYLLGDSLELYWMSSSSSEHSVHLRRCGRASISVFRATEEWRQIVGIQARGNAERVERASRAIMDAYIERFHLGPVLSLAVLRSSLYVFRPDWIRYIDNSKVFGNKFEINLGC
jgi:uncharacterized protein YhbP (UPF0306 family)